jgi:peptidoglycan/LPS O-acetylase OafA/YrhL
MKPEFLKSIAGLRFLCALHLVIYHIALPALVAAHFPDAILLLANSGSFSTSLFFILSGFVLGRSYSQKPFETGKFLRTRLKKIYPAYFLGFFLALPFCLGLPLKALLVSVGLYLSFLSCWMPDYNFINGVSWALGVFLFCYLIFNFLNKTASRLYLRSSFIGFLIIWILALIPGVYCTISQPNLYEQQQVPFQLYWNQTLWFFHSFPLFRVAEFLAGIYASKIQIDSLKKVFSKRPALIDLSILSCGIVVLGALFISDHFRVILFIVHHGLLLPLQCALLILLSLNQGLFSKVLGNNLMMRLGKTSILVYLLHRPLYGWAILLLNRTEMASPFSIFEMGLFITAVCLFCVWLTRDRTNRVDGYIISEAIFSKISLKFRNLPPILVINRLWARRFETSTAISKCQSTNVLS